MANTEIPSISELLSKMQSLTIERDHKKSKKLIITRMYQDMSGQAKEI